jgi:hypothetical protein
MLDFPVPGAALEKFVLAIVLLYAFLHGQGSGAALSRPSSVRPQSTLCGLRLKAKMVSTKVGCVALTRLLLGFLDGYQAD